MTTYLYWEGAMTVHLFEVCQGKVLKEETHALSVAATVKLNRVFFQNIKMERSKLLV